MEGRAAGLPVADDVLHRQDTACIEHAGARRYAACRLGRIEVQAMPLFKERQCADLLDGRHAVAAPQTGELGLVAARRGQTRIEDIPGNRINDWSSATRLTARRVACVPSRAMP